MAGIEQKIVRTGSSEQAAVSQSQGTAQAASSQASLVEAARETKALLDNLKNAFLRNAGGSANSTLAKLSRENISDNKSTDSSLKLLDLSSLA